MAVRFWPYAAKAVVQHQWDTNHLDVWVTFRHPMDQTVKPANGLWLCEADSVAKNCSASAWQDAWTLLLTIDNVNALPDEVTLEYDGPDENLITTWDKQWEAWGPILSLNIPYGWEDVLFVDIANRRVGVNAPPLNYTFEVGSADLSERVSIYHDNANAFFRTSDGVFIFLTDRGTNANTNLWVRGKGTGFGQLRVYDENDQEYTFFTTVSGVGYLSIEGVSPVLLTLQDQAQVPINCFAAATEGETQLFAITGYRAGDAQKILLIAVGYHAADTASFFNVSNYYFAGNIFALRRIASGALILAAAGPTDDYDVSGINTLFLDCSANDVTIGGFAGGVAGQVLHIARLCAAANDATLEHNHPGGTQKILLHAGADETLTGEYGGWILACNGTNWYDISHAKHV